MEETVKTNKKTRSWGAYASSKRVFCNQSDLTRKAESVLFLTLQSISGDVGEGAFKVSELP